MQTKNFLRVLAAVSFVSAQTTGKLGDAVEVSGNPKGAAYIATFNGTLVGGVTASANPSGKGVDFVVKVEGLAVDKGPFS
jgi:hypothetical protein